AGLPRQGGGGVRGRAGPVHEALPAAHGRRPRRAAGVRERARGRARAGRGPYFSARTSVSRTGEVWKFSTSKVLLSPSKLSFAAGTSVPSPLPSLVSRISATMNA